MSDELKSTPSKDELRRFIAVFEALDAFEATQRHIRGYGAFDPTTHQMPNPAVVEVMGWLRELAS